MIRASFWHFLTTGHYHRDWANERGDNCFDIVCRKCGKIFPND